MSWDVIIAKSSKSAHTFAPLTSVCRNGLNPQGSYPVHPLMREQSGGCESADHPNFPARPREMCCLFGSGSSGLGGFFERGQHGPCKVRVGPSRRTHPWTDFKGARPLTEVQDWAAKSGPMRLLAGFRPAPWRFLEPSHLDTPRVTSH